MIFEEKTLSSERIYEGKILNLRRDKIIDVRGKASYREIVEHCGGVAIAAVTEEKRMILVRQFRKAAEKAILEVPAGRLKKEDVPQQETRGNRLYRRKTRVYHIFLFIRGVFGGSDTPLLCKRAQSR